jgi:predicted MPP superfamily phosphohydrolase
MKLLSLWLVTALLHGYIAARLLPGLHTLQDLWVYTSRGTGYWGPPKRFGAPSEITLLRLVLV